MKFIDILPLISSIFVFLLGVFVFAKKRHSRISFTFFLHAIAISIWLFSTSMMFINKGNIASAIFWDRVVYVAVVFIPAFMYHFGLAVRKKKNDNLLYLAYFFSVLFLFLVPTKYFVNGTFEYKWGIHTQARFFHHMFLVYFASYVVIWFLQMIRYYKTIRSLYEKRQIKFIFIGFLLLFSIGPLAFLPAYGLEIYPFAYFSGLIFSIFIAYAIVKHRLMDIKMVLRSSSVYLASLSTILAFAICVNAALYRYFPDSVYWTNILLLILATSSFSALKKKYFYLANKYFFSSLYDPQKLIGELSDRLRTTLNIDVIYNYVFQLLDKAFHFKGFAILSYDDKKGNYYLEFNKGFNVGRRKKFEGSSALHDKLIGHNKTIITEEVKKDFYNDNTKDVIDLLVALQISVLIPLNVKDRTVGLIALGKKESGDVYTEGDLRLFEIVGAQAATAIENAFLYEKTLNFNTKLKDEIRKATRELVKANNKLKKLDEAKSEFISIASHQLRTPLTIIKGYISMILEGNFGELTKGEKESLEKVYLSNERLIGLVENLLNISRIESGRLQFDYKKMQLGDIVTSVFEELKPKAKEKKLRFTYRKTKKKLPALKIDEEKIRQVVMNMVDNAIKYTKKGSVTISLKEVTASDAKMGKCLELKVSDSGMGILADDLPNLFKKFSRGTGTSLVHTEGTGLGLYVAKQMIEAHGGKAWAESKGEGKGSKFCFRIPVDDSVRKTET